MFNIKLIAERYLDVSIIVFVRIANNMVSNIYIYILSLVYGSCKFRVYTNLLVNHCNRRYLNIDFFFVKFRI